MQIVKAEILWTRECKQKCPYCAMATGRNNIQSLERWIRGIDNLKELGCEFIAFYGAEPLQDFHCLDLVVGYAEMKGIKTTVITSGLAPSTDDKIDRLYRAGLRSLTMSYDMTPISKKSWPKSQGAIARLEDFRQRPYVRDVAAVVTLTSRNYIYLPDTIEELSAKNIWTFFDFIHCDRGNPGTKCRNYNGIDDLMFSENDLHFLLPILEEVLRMKQTGYLCHTSEAFINMIRENDGERLFNYDWNCAEHECFPSWVTIDCDGTVFPCDDFQPKVPNFRIHMTELAKRWDEFCTVWGEAVRDLCEGCLWNTHIDAHLIKQGSLPLSDYVHSEVQCQKSTI